MSLFDELVAGSPRGESASLAQRPRVLLLASDLVDQIAAGEVVERPASVVKELVENAIDAGAKSIQVETEAAGLARIVVTDDGHGMDREDAWLSVARHATSKIRKVEDLSTLHTMGFRGEALPSIASVSRFSIRTRPHDAVEGVEVRIEGGGAATIQVAGGAAGTSVRVDELFFNVPARRKFLKSAATESAQISETLLRIALANPTLRLVWMRDGRRAKEWAPANDGYQRALQLFPDEKLGALEGERDGVHVRAMLSAPERARVGAQHLHVSVNGRVVRDRALARAITFAYGSTVPPGRTPVGVVWLSLSPDRVDANVHPQKAEVRFADARVVLDNVTRILASGLGHSPFRSRPNVVQSATPTASSDEELNDPWQLAGVQPVPDEPAADYEMGTLAPAWMSDAGVVSPQQGYRGLRVLGQVARTYIVCEGPNGLVVLDQHAADERVRHAKLAADYSARDVSVQRWLMPERVDLSEREVVLATEQEATLAALGLEVRVLGPRTVTLVGTPALLKNVSADRLLRDVLAELGRTGSRAFGDAVDTALATMACHGSIRAGQALSMEEMRALILSLANVESFAGHCPHGRPVAHTISLSELSRGVGR